MFENLPSLRGFQPKSYSGGPAGFYLPLLYDLVASEKPKLVVMLGWSDGDAFFTFCQAALEQGVDGECIAVRREREGEPEEDDVAWRKGRDYGEEFYGDRARFVASMTAALAELANESVELLLLDDFDIGSEIQADLSAWEPKLAPGAIVLLHGAGVEREDAPKAAWQKWLGQRPAAFFPEGLGLAIARQGEAKSSPSVLAKELFGRRDKVKALAQIYSLAAARIDALGRAAQAEQAKATLEIRQVWLDSLLADRSKVQQIMDHQARTLEHQAGVIAHLEGRLKLVIAEQEEQRRHFENLQRDRAKAQLVMDSQHEQLKDWVAEGDKLRSQLEQLKTQFKEQKRILNAAKLACRNKGRCFQIQTGPKVRRPLGEKIARELRRLPRNLGIARTKEPAAAPETPPVPAPPRAPLDRYEEWIRRNEPDSAALERQRRLSKQFP
ncbi:MAG TPA: class I SAM-dependent methyltransferase, partial [Chthoniobacterales bacterium]